MFLSGKRRGSPVYSARIEWFVSEKGNRPAGRAVEKRCFAAGKPMGYRRIFSLGFTQRSGKRFDIRGRVSSVPGNYPAFYDSLYESVRLGKPLAVPPEEPARVIRILEACLESHNKRITVDLREE